MANVTLKTDFSIPKLLQGDIHDLLEVCGYTLHRQDHFTATYIRANYKLTFQDSTTVLFQVCEDGMYANRIYTTIFCGTIKAAMTDVEAMLLLQSIGAIDITKVLPFREVFGTAIKTTKLLPMAKSNVDWWAKGMEEHKQACSQIQMSGVNEGAAL